MKQLLCFYISIIKRHPVIVGLLACLAVFLLLRWYPTEMFRQRAANLVAILIGTLVLDSYFLFQTNKTDPIKIFKPKSELILSGISVLTELVWLHFEFSGYNERLIGIPRLIWMVVGLGCMYNLIIALIFLFGFKYKLKDLGFRCAYIWAALPVIFIFGAVSWFFGTWTDINSIIHTYGSPLKTLLIGVFIAALPEEFSRFIWQTRMGVLLRNSAVGWLLASILWCALHYPRIPNCEYLLAILPFGLFWGYVTYRTRSILPSVLIHGTNMWRWC